MIFGSKTSSETTYLELTWQAGTLAFFSLYALGMIVVNFYLMSIGFSDFELIRLRYVFVGGLLAAPLFFFYCLIVSVTILFKNNLATNKDVFVHAFVFNLTVFFALIAFKLDDDFVIKNYWEYLLIVIVSCIASLVPTVSIKLRKNFAKWRSFTSWAGSRSKPILDLSSVRRFFAFLLVAIPLVAYLWFFSRYAFPRLSEQIGGGEPKKVVFIVDEGERENAEAIGIQLDTGTNESQVMAIFWEGDGYLVIGEVPVDSDAAFRVSQSIFLGWDPERTSPYDGVGTPIPLSAVQE